MRKKEVQEEAPLLIISRNEAEVKIKEIKINNESELDSSKQKYKKWSEFNSELLKRIFNNDVIANEYNYTHGSGRVVPDPIWGNSFPVLHENYQNSISAKLEKLDSIFNRLELIPFSESVVSSVEPAVKIDNNDVFIVHGHDEEAKQTVARIIEKIGLRAIILHEQPNKGRTIINKFQDYSNVGFAVVLLTPDDIGSSRAEQDNLKSRARQNVVFELGFFLGKLGNERVCALKKGDLDLPSDYQGVLWINIDENNAWQLLLAKELKAAGYRVDLNNLV